MDRQTDRRFSEGERYEPRRSKSGTLRSAETIAKFQAAPQQPGQAGTPVLTYFSTLLESAPGVSGFSLV